MLVFLFGQHGRSKELLRLLTWKQMFRCAGFVDMWWCSKWCSWAFIVEESTVSGQKEVQKWAANVERRWQRDACYHLSKLTWDGMVYTFCYMRLICYSPKRFVFFFFVLFFNLFVSFVLFVWFVWGFWLFVFQKLSVLWNSLWNDLLLRIDFCC